jgi:heme exporter protein B
MKAFAALLKRDLRLVLLRSGEGMSALFFFGVVACLFPFALGASPEVLRPAAAGIVWVAALLAALLALESVWHRDDINGMTALLLAEGTPALLLVSAKMLAHWLASGATLVLASVIVAPMLHFPPGLLPVLLPSLLMGTLYMSLLGGFGAVLTAGARRPGLLLALLVLPLFIPMLILGVAGADAALAASPATPYLLLQAALLLAALPVAPFAAAAFLNSGRRLS